MTYRLRTKDELRQIVYRFVDNDTDDELFDYLDFLENDGEITNYDKWVCLDIYNNE